MGLCKKLTFGLLAELWGRGERWTRSSENRKPIYMLVDPIGSTQNEWTEEYNFLGDFPQIVLKKQQQQQILLLEVFHTIEKFWLETKGMAWLVRTFVLDWTISAAAALLIAFCYQKHNGTTSEKQVLLSFKPLVRANTLSSSGVCKAVTEMVSMFGEWCLCGAIYLGILLFCWRNQHIFCTYSRGESCRE